MSLMFQKTYLKWREPKAYLESSFINSSKDKTIWQKAKMPIILFVVFFGSFMLQYWSAKIKKGSNSPAMINAFMVDFACAAFLSIFLSLIYRYGHRLSPPEIKMQDNRLVRSSMLGHSLYKYENIKAFSFCTFAFEKFTCNELVLELKKKQKIVKIGFDDSRIRDEIKMILIRKGLAFYQ